MSAQKQEFFPIVDRRAPVLERIREAREDKDMDVEELGEELGAMVAVLSQVEDEEVVDSAEGKLTESIASGIEDELGEGEVNEEFVEELAGIIASYEYSGEDEQATFEAE